MIITQLRGCKIRKELLVWQKYNKQKDIGLYNLGSVWISYGVPFYFKSAYHNEMHRALIHATLISVKNTDY